MKRRTQIIVAVALAVTCLASLGYAVSIADEVQPDPAAGGSSSACPIWQCGFNGTDPRLAQAKLERLIPALSGPAKTAAVGMFIADYCGNGSSWTSPNARIAWRWAWGSVADALPSSDQTTWHLEAIWGEHGALCLDQPRLANRDEVVAACPIPRCSDLRRIPDKAIWISWSG